MNLVIRIRGRINLKQEVKDTFKMLRLARSHSCVILPDTPIYKGMIKRVKDYIMYGPISESALKELLDKRLIRKDGKKPDSALIEKVIKTIKSGKLLKDVDEVVPYLRLHPPIGGFKRKGIKSTVKQGGDLGFHESMDELAKKMM